MIPRIFLLLVPLCLAASGLLNAAAPRPNVIFILTDDLGYGDLGSFYQNSRNFAANRNKPAFATPKLDQMAAEGASLTRHYCGAPVCAPSRASLILGVTQGHANVRDNQFDKALENNHTVASVMRGAGYATAIIGKWGLQGTGAIPEAHPQYRGFDYFYGYMTHINGHHHYPKESGNAVWDGLATTNLANLDKCYTTDLWTARAKKWIVDQRSAHPAQPFFMYLAYDSPHAELSVPTSAYPSGGGSSGGMQWLGTPGNMISSATGTVDSFIHPDYASATYDNDNNSNTAEIAWPAAEKRHATMVRRLDDSVADLIQTLKDLGIDNDTLVVFTSDNGPHNEAGETGTYTQDPTFFDSFGPLDGIKRDSLEGGLRVPAIVRWPTHIPTGVTRTDPSQFQDWMATFAELAGVAVPARCDGVSLLPTLTGSGNRLPSTIYTEYYFNGSTPGYTEFLPAHRNQLRNQQQVLWLGGYKGIRYNTASNTGTPFKIYNISVDPQEGTDLSGQPGIPTQLDFQKGILELRRPNSSATRPYDNELVPPLTPSPVRPGVAWKAYEAEFPWVPSFATVTPTASGETPRPDVVVRTRDNNVGLEFTGYVQVPADGDYTFFMTADTGAFLRLHKLQLLDGDKGYAAGSEISATVKLKAGLHPFTLGYRRGTVGTPSLGLSWSGPGIAKQAIPVSAFFTDGAAPPVPPTAINDSAISYGTGVLVDVLANDSDDGTPQPLSISAVTTPGHGTAVIQANKILYTPAAGFFGDDTFGYTITDGADTASATVTIAVLPQADAVWLPLDETSGTAVHDALGRTIGAVVGAATPQWTTGKWNGGLQLDGVDDHVVLNGYKGVTGTAAQTVTFWLNAGSQAPSVRSTITSWGSSNGGAAGTRFDINLNHTSNYILRAEFNASGVNFTTPTRGDLRNAGWVHCAIVVPTGATVSQVRGYLDGVRATAALEPSNAGGTSINITSLNDVVIGNWATDITRPFNGIIDDFRIFSRALSDAEIASLAAKTTASNDRSQWFLRYTGNSLPGPTDWAADTDADGWSNALEFALGGNPTSSDQSLAPYLTVADGLKYHFNRRQIGIAASSYQPEFSETLASGSWSPLAPPTVISHPVLPGFDLVSVPVPASSTSAGFVRLRVDP